MDKISEVINNRTTTKTPIYRDSTNNIRNKLDWKAKPLPPKLKETMKKFSEISHQNTIYFFEVPNCTSNVLKIHSQHTYYFSRKFFYNYFNIFIFIFG